MGFLPRTSVLVLVVAMACASAAYCDSLDKYNGKPRVRFFAETHNQTESLQRRDVYEAGHQIDAPLFTYERERKSARAVVGFSLPMLPGIPRTHFDLGLGSGEVDFELFHDPMVNPNRPIGLGKSMEYGMQLAFDIGHPIVGVTLGIGWEQSRMEFDRDRSSNEDYRHARYVETRWPMMLGLYVDVPHFRASMGVRSANVRADATISGSATEPDINMRLEEDFPFHGYLDLEFMWNDFKLRYIRLGIYYGEGVGARFGCGFSF